MLVNSTKYAEMLAFNRSWKLPAGVEPYTVGILSNIVIYQLKDVLEYALRTAGIPASVQVGEYDNVVQDSLRFRDKRLVVVFWEAFNFSDQLRSKGQYLAEAELADLLLHWKRQIDSVLEALSPVPLVLFNRFSPWAAGALVVEDGAWGRICRELNQHIEQSKPANVILVDVAAVAAQVSIRETFDWRNFYESRVLYSLNFLRQYVQGVFPAVAAAAGRAKKVLVLDCDDTLWGGIVGEDGVPALAMTPDTFKGMIFHEAQSLYAALRERGVLLALCSKNNPEDVDAVFAGRTDMVLKSSDLVCKKVGWGNKAEAIEAIARELNLGLDAVVFVDDSEFEVRSVKDMLPQVTTFCVPQAIQDYPGMIRSLAGLFFNPFATKEDRQKTEMYAQEARRELVRAKFGNMEDYLRSLKLQLRVMISDPALVGRMAQLSQKTNQFNLTTRRYTESQIAAFCDDGNCALFAVNVADAFGDYGVTGLAVVTLDRHKLEADVDTFLLSCRVLGRNIELVFFEAVVGWLKSQGIKRITAHYRATPKNAQVADFWDRLALSRSADGGSGRDYVLSLDSYNKQPIDYIGVEYGKQD
ncbi:MAG: HAD-IIIC family phosphatase [Candidatus Omnitrophica bacterium]|nr:HAD-IIIC family phosphatase [Candidatus Omnitrophota bacterium]